MSTLSPAIPGSQSKAGWRALKLPGAGNLAVPIAVLAIVVALIMPMPPLLLDVLIVLDMGRSVIVLMVTMYILKPVD
ncbi:MAG: hypothetical protein JO319_17185, partial [Acidobacteriaceae bacterium]|nr:hypothetical protein [Acidobacteriaceae bacterium]